MSNMFLVVSLDNQLVEDGVLYQSHLDGELSQGFKFAVAGDYGYCGGFATLKEAINYCKEEISTSGSSDTFCVECQ
jgi:hypothetical protein